MLLADFCAWMRLYGVDEPSQSAGSQKPAIQYEDVVWYFSFDLSTAFPRHKVALHDLPDSVGRL